ncbi:type II secretion system major pseudopilin GspG [Noviherbaspirillum pedocola]|uniref:type II secretion system major pseudopilin GspG n=1 Tax=Noviherbaspirillum pedocola TaxID=2801341 RepID=UPI003898EB6D
MKYNQGRVTEPVPKPLLVLITVIPAVILIGIVAAIVVPAVKSKPAETAVAPIYSKDASTYRPTISDMIGGRKSQAKVIAAGQDIGILMTAMKMYEMDNGRYPTTDQGLVALVRRPETGPIPTNWKEGGYIESLPLDPWGTPYQYLSPGIHGEIDIFSLGADGQPGGAGFDADIGSWQDQ